MHFVSFCGRAPRREIEELSRAIGPQAPGSTNEGPNSEYPWQARSSSGEIDWHAPVTYDFGLLDRLLFTANGAAILTFLRTLADRMHVLL